MKRNSQQYAPCASKEQIEKATRVVNESENQELKKLAGDIIILLSRVTEFKNANAGKKMFRDMAEIHLDNIVENLEKCIDEALQAENDVRLSSVLAETRENSSSYNAEEVASE